MSNEPAVSSSESSFYAGGAHIPFPSMGVEREKQDTFAPEF